MFSETSKQSLSIGGSRGGVPGARPPPPMGPNSFVFAYIFTEKCPHRRSTPPPLREILDPPLLSDRFTYINFSKLILQNSPLYLNAVQNNTKTCTNYNKRWQLKCSKTGHLRSLIWTATCLVRPLYEVNLSCNSINLMFFFPLL